MEVPGRKLRSSENRTSSLDLERVCQQCQEDNKHAPATKFCCQCKQFFCKECCDIHKKVKAVRHHNLVDIANIKSKSIAIQAKPPKIVCSIHCDKLLDFFCPLHNLTCCGVRAMDHKKCSYSYIPDISKNYNTSDEYKKLQSDIQETIKEVSTYFSEVEDGIYRIEQSGDRTIVEIRKHRKEISKHLKQKQAELVRQVEAFKNEDVSDLRKAMEYCKNVHAELLEMEHKIKDLEEDKSDLLITNKVFISKVEGLKLQVNAHKSKHKTISYCYKTNKAYQSIRSSNGALGTVEKVKIDNTTNCNKRHTDKASSNQTYMPKKDLHIHKNETSRIAGFDVKSVKDTNVCWITGMSFKPPQTLLLTDHSNCCAKSFDIKTNSILACLALTSAPWDVANLISDQAAVTLPSESKIQIICSMKKTLFGVRIIKVSGKCRGIDTTSDKIVVSYVDSGKVEVLDMRGNVLQTFGGNKDERHIFHWPEYVCFASENTHEVIYVTDNNTSIVTKLSMEGEVLFTYKFEGLSRPKGVVATEDGYIVVCGSSSDTVQLVSMDGTISRKLLTDKDGITQTFSVCYNKLSDIIYLSCSDSLTSTLRVFELKEKPC